MGVCDGLLGILIIVAAVVVEFFALEWMVEEYRNDLVPPDAFYSEEQKVIILVVLSLPAPVIVLHLAVIASCPRSETWNFLRDILGLLVGAVCVAFGIIWLAFWWFDGRNALDGTAGASGFVSDFWLSICSNCCAPGQPLEQASCETQPICIVDNERFERLLEEAHGIPNLCADVPNLCASSGSLDQADLQACFDTLHNFSNALSVSLATFFLGLMACVGICPQQDKNGNPTVIVVRVRGDDQGKR